MKAVPNGDWKGEGPPLGAALLPSGPSARLPNLCGGAPPSTPSGVTAGPLPQFPRGSRGRVGTDSFPKRHFWAAFGGPCRMRGRSAPRTPRVTLSMEKESPESQAGESPPPPPYVSLLLLGKRSRSARPCPTGAKPHQARECLSRRQPPKSVTCRGSLLTTHKTSRGIPGFSIPSAGSLASRYHQYSSEYSAGTCPVWVGDVAFLFFQFHPANKFPTRWAWLGGRLGVWMKFHVRSILAPGTAPGRMACRFFREHGKNRSLPAEKERLRKLGVQGHSPGGVPGLAPGGGIGKGG